MKKGWVYILKCSDKSYYTGSTSNLEKRIAEHQNGVKASYTSSKLPVELVYSQEYQNIKDGVEAERRIKGWSRKKKEALIMGDFKLLHELAKCKNETSYKNKEN